MVIRLADRRDCDALAAIYRPAVTDGAISFEIEPPDAAAMAARVEKTLSRLPWIVYELDGVVAGYAYGSPYRDRPAYQWSVEVSAYVRQDVRRAGAGRALYTSLFAILALQGYRSAFAGITLPNEASVGLHRAMGFTPVGIYHGVGYKFGEWHDVGWFERPLAPRDSDPRAPVALPSLVDQASLHDALATGLTRATGRS
jgi:L-amino acid N-acyltransferase YncA